MIGYGFHSQAAAELEGGLDFYETEKVELCREFLDEVVRTISRIRQYPHAAPRVSKRSRRWRLRRFPFGLVYQVRGDSIAILAVMHLHRQPGYWKDRETLPS